jgi:4-hydroxy-3-methylbut-2-enyl diphosphate reductase
MGVRRALEIVFTEANQKDGPLYTYGPLIHNTQVLELLQSRGVNPIEDPAAVSQGRIVIRAHGIGPAERQAIRETGLRIVDATCPKVARVQSIIRYHTKKGLTAIIVGDKDHPEVLGLVGYSSGPVFVVREPGEVAALSLKGPLFVVAQTTQDETKYLEVVRAVRDRYPDALVFETICDATLERQEEVRSLAREVDAVVVVGGYHSGNTQRLAQIAQAAGVPTFHVETAAALEEKAFVGMETIGVTAGASTPNWMIKNVIQTIEGFRGRGDKRIKRTLFSLIKFAVSCNLLAGAGAFSFALAAMVLSEIGPSFPHALMAFLYIYAMHTLYPFLDKGASAYNDPERASFHRRYGQVLIPLALTAIVACLATAYSIGPLTLASLGTLTILGALYNIPLMPLKKQGPSRFFKMKDIPGSKTLAESFAWLALISIVPIVERTGFRWAPVLTSGVVVLFMGYVRSALFDLFRVQGDLIVGRETLPITLGEKRTIQLLKGVLSACAAVLAGAPLLGFAGAFAFILLVPLVTLSLCLRAYERRWVHPGWVLESFVEGTFFLAGLLALVWVGSAWPW